MATGGYSRRLQPLPGGHVPGSTGRSWRHRLSTQGSGGLRPRAHGDVQACTPAGAGTSGAESRAPVTASQRRPHQAGGVGTYRPTRSLALLALWSQACPGQGMSLRALLASGTQTPTPSPASCLLPAPPTHMRVCVSPAHSRCQPRQTPPVAPCGWRRYRQPEGQAWSRPGPCRAVVRASLWTGPGLAGWGAGEVLWGPPPRPAARARSCVCRIPFLSREHPCFSIKVFGGLWDTATSLCAIVADAGFKGQAGSRHAPQPPPPCAYISHTWSGRDVG